MVSAFPHVRILRNQANLGFARANNLGIAASTGQYVCLINSDVKVLPDCVNRLVDYCKQNPQAGMVGPRVIGGDGKLQRSCRGFPTIWNMFCRALALDTLFRKWKLFSGYTLSFWPQDCLRRVDVLSGCFWLIRRSALDEVGLLDEAFFMYAEDIDWCKRFWLSGWQVVFLPSAEAIHYGGASSSNAPVRFFIEKQRADLQYWRKHHGRVAMWGYFLIACLHLSTRAAGYGLAMALRKGRAETNRYKLKRSIACLGWMFTGRFPAAAAC